MDNSEYLMHYLVVLIISLEVDGRFTHFSIFVNEKGRFCHHDGLCKGQSKHQKRCLQGKEDFELKWETECDGKSTT